MEASELTSGSRIAKELQYNKFFTQQYRIISVRVAPQLLIRIFDVE